MSDSLERSPTPAAEVMDVDPLGDAPEASPLADLRGRGRAIAGLGQALGLTPERLAGAEALDRLELATSMALDALEGLDTGELAAWFAALGDDVRLDLRLAGLEAASAAPAVTLRGGRDPSQALRRFRSSAHDVATSQGNDVTVDVRLAVGKARAKAAARALLTSRPDFLGSAELMERTTIAVYFHTQAWLRVVSARALADWERLGLARADGRAVVLLCDGEGYLAGPALDVVGAVGAAGDTPRWLTLSRTGWRQFQERAEHARALRDEEGHWPGAPQVLTPAHVRFEERAPGLEAVAQALRALRAALSAAYLASAVQETKDQALMLRFGGPRPASCELPAATATKKLTANVPQAAALARLADWAYDNASPDKLAIAREALARELPPGAQVALADVEAAAVPALEAAKANFVLYLRHNTERYFQLRQQALDAVTAYTESIRKSVTELTSDVVDTVYRTGGLLVGVVIASLIEPRATLPVQRLVAILILAYVLFMLLFLMRARWQRYTLEAGDLAGRLSAMPELSESERQGLRVRATAADAYFRRYFRWSCIVYAVFAAAALLYFLALLVFPAPGALPPAPAPTATPRVP
jgi:hypothetical protein